MNDQPTPQEMKTESTTSLAGVVLRRFVLWATRRAESVAEMIERRNMRVALRVCCHAQAWLRNLGYAEAAASMGDPIRRIAAASVKPSPQKYE